VRVTMCAVWREGLLSSRKEEIEMVEGDSPLWGDRVVRGSDAVEGGVVINMAQDVPGRAYELPEVYREFVGNVTAGYPVLEAAKRAGMVNATRGMLSRLLRTNKGLRYAMGVALGLGETDDEVSLRTALIRHDAETMAMGPEKVLGALERIAEKAEEAESYPNALRAWELLGRSVGVFERAGAGGGGGEIRIRFADGQDWRQRRGGEGVADAEVVGELVDESERGA